MQELVIYILIMSFSAVIGMFATNKLLENFPENLSKLAKVSLWSVWLINAWDFYLFLYHVALSVVIKEAFHCTERIIYFLGFIWISNFACFALLCFVNYGTN